VEEDNYKHNDFGGVFWFHLVIIVLLYSSWMFFYWRWVAAVAILIMLQFLVLKQCLVTTMEFKSFDSDRNWTHYYLTKMGLQLNKKVVNSVVCYICPLILIGIAYCWQIVLDHKPFF